MFTKSAILASMALSAIAQSTTSAPSGSQTVITGLVGTLAEGYAASIISANPCDTTMVLECTADSCGQAEDVPITVTQGPTAREFVFATSIAGGRATYAESCDLQGPSGSFTRAVCAVSLYASGGGQDFKTVSTVTATDPAELTYAPITVTAGASKLPSAGATCSTSSGSGAAPTSIISIVKVLVPAGAALAAGVGAML